MIILYVALIAFFSGLVKGISGFGSSLVALPLLLIFYPINEVVVIMITYNVILNVLLHFENQGFNVEHLKDIWILSVFGVLATFIGIYLLEGINEKAIRCFAVMLIILAIINKVVKFKYQIKNNYINQIITGFLSGLGNGVASIDGPPIVFFLTGIKAEKKQFKNTLASYFLFLGILSVGLLAMNGRYNLVILFDIGYITTFAIIGVIVGILISKRISEKIFDKVIVVILIFLGFAMIL